MQITLYPYRLLFKYPFKISYGIRSATDAVYIKVEQDEQCGWGEAALPPYLKEDTSSVIQYLRDVNTACGDESVDVFLEQLEAFRFNGPARAALEMALLQLKAKTTKKTLSDVLGISTTEISKEKCFYTIGLCTKEEMQVKLEDAKSKGFVKFKLKLSGTAEDYAVVENFLSLGKDLAFAVDLNNASVSKENTMKFLSYLKEKKCLLAEQVMNKELDEEMTAFRETYQGFIYADESCQRYADVERLQGKFGGINIKLMKCGGMREALRMIRKARELNMGVLMGCMSESSVGCTAAAHLAGLCDWVDLDGPYLIANDPFQGMRLEGERLKVNALQQLSPLGEGIVL